MMVTGAADNNAVNYERYYLLTDLNGEMICRAKEMFEGYCTGGVVFSGNFDDGEWVITNQVKKTTLRFLPNEFLFKRHAENWLGCSYRCFVDGIKVYAVFNMDGYTIRGIRDIVNALVAKGR